MIHTPFKTLQNGRATITIQTPPSVKKELAEIFDLATQANKDGQQGAVFCQIDQNIIKVVFLPQDHAIQVKNAFLRAGKEGTAS